MAKELTWPYMGLTLAETAAALRVDKRSILSAIHEDALPARKVGREWRISKKALETWLACGDLSGKNFKNDEESE